MYFKFFVKDCLYNYYLCSVLVRIEIYLEIIKVFYFKIRILFYIMNIIY